MCSHQKAQPAQQTANVQHTEGPDIARPELENSAAIEASGLGTSAQPSKLEELSTAFWMLPASAATLMLEALPPEVGLSLHGLLFASPAYQAWLLTLPDELVAQHPELCNRLLSGWLEEGTAFFVRGGFPQIPGFPTGVQAERWLEHEAGGRGVIGTELAFTLAESAAIGTQVSGADGALGPSAGMGTSLLVRGRLSVELPEAASLFASNLGVAAMMTPGIMESSTLASLLCGSEPELTVEIEAGAGLGVQIDPQELAAGPLAGLAEGGLPALDASLLGMGVVHTDAHGAGYLELRADERLQLEPGSALADGSVEQLCAALAHHQDVSARVYFQCYADGSVGYGAAEARVDDGTELRTLEFGERRQLRAWLDERKRGEAHPHDQEETLGQRIAASGLLGLTRSLHLPLPEAELAQVCPDWMAQVEKAFPDAGVVRAVSELELVADARVDARAVAEAYWHTPFAWPEGMDAVQVAEEALRGVIAHLQGKPAPDWLPAPPLREDLVAFKAPRIQGELLLGAGLAVGPEATGTDLGSAEAGLRVDLPYEGALDLEELAEREPRLG